MLEITRPSRQFGADVGHRDDGSGIQSDLTVRMDSPLFALAALGNMAELRYGADYWVNRYFEIVGDVELPFPFAEIGR